MIDVLSVIGLLMGLLAIFGGNALDGGHLASLINGPAFIIVCGGTIGAVLLQTPMRVFVHSARIVVWVLYPPNMDMLASIDKIVRWSHTARRDGLLGLEGEVKIESDAFISRGLQMLVDGTEPQVIRSLLEIELENCENHDLAAAQVFAGMGGYAPTIGILGAVMGLIHVMENLSDPVKLGSGIATAFVATIYGVGLANLLFLPVANKLKSNVYLRSLYREMLIEGLIAIAEGENPRHVEEKLRGYLKE